MSASHAALDNTQELIFNKAMQFFATENVNEIELKAYWQAALPAHADQNDYLQKQLDSFKQKFLGQEQVVFSVHPDGQEIVNKWSVKDLNVYYTSRNDKPEIQKILEKRRILTISEHTFTEYDDFQLVRDAGSDAANQRAILKTYLNKLFVISYSFFVIGKSSHPQHIYFLTVLRLLDYFRSLLPEENPTYPAETIIRIDAITEHVALVYLNVITRFQVDEEKVILKNMLEKFDHFDQEISPWLALYFRPTLLSENDPENKLAHEFLKFHSLRHPETAVGLIAKLQGGDIETVLIALLGAEKQLWQSLRGKTLEDKLKFLNKYIYYAKLSDWITMNICMDLVKESNVHGLEGEFSWIAYRLIQRIKRENFYLPKSSDYLINIMRDVRDNEAEKKRMIDTCPALYLSLTCDTIIELQLTAAAINQYPPSAKLFYARGGISQLTNSLDEKEEKLPDSHLGAIAQLKTFDSKTQHQYLTAIFSNHRYLNYHQDFILSDTAAELNLNDLDFPLIALRLHYSEKKLSTNLVELWESLLDSNCILDDDFFSYAENRELFSRIQDLKTGLLIPQKILENPQRYRRLALALVIFETQHGRINNALRGSLHFIPSPKAEWAGRFYADIIRFVAYPIGNNQMDFSNIVRFVNVPLDNRITIEKDKISAQTTKYIMDYYANHLELNPNHINKLIFSFMKLFKASQSLSAWEIAKIKAFPLEQLHPLCIAWADLSFLDQYFTLAIFEPVERQMELSQIMAVRTTQNSILSLLSNSIRGLNFGGPTPAVFQNVEDNTPYLAFLLNYNSAYYSARLKQSLPLDDNERAIIAYQAKPANIHFQEQQVLSFIKIYNALRVAQSGPTSNWVKTVNLKNKPAAEALEMITQHVTRQHSRTQKAWELVNALDGQPLDESFDLLKAIYSYSFRHSFFKKSSFTGENYYRTSTLEAKLQSLPPILFGHCRETEPNTRMGKIVRALSR